MIPLKFDSLSICVNVLQKTRAANNLPINVQKFQNCFGKFQFQAKLCFSAYEQFCQFLSI